MIFVPEKFESSDLIYVQVLTYGGNMYHHKAKIITKRKVSIVHTIELALVISSLKALIKPRCRVEMHHGMQSMML